MCCVLRYFSTLTKVGKVLQEPTNDAEVPASQKQWQMIMTRRLEGSRGVSPESKDSWSHGGGCRNYSPERFSHCLNFIVQKPGEGGKEGKNTTLTYLLLCPCSRLH